MLGNLAFCSGTVKICCWGSLGLTAFTIAEGIEDCSPTHHPTTILGHFRSSPLQFVIFGHTAHWCTLCQYPEKRGTRPPTLKHWERRKNWWLEMLGRAIWPSPKNVALVSRSEGEKNTADLQALIDKFPLVDLAQPVDRAAAQTACSRLRRHVPCIVHFTHVLLEQLVLRSCLKHVSRLRPQQQEANNRRVHLCVGLANNRANWINTKTQYPKTTEHFNYSKRYWSKV